MEVNQRKEGNAMLRVYQKQAKFDQPPRSISISNVINRKEIFIIDLQCNLILNIALSLMLDALVSLLFLGLDLPVWGFVINTIEEGTEGDEGQIEEEEDEDVDECYPIDEILDSLGWELIGNCTVWGWWYEVGVDHTSVGSSDVWDCNKAVTVTWCGQANGVSIVDDSGVFIISKETNLLDLQIHLCSDSLVEEDISQTCQSRNGGVYSAGEVDIDNWSNCGLGDGYDSGIITC